MSGGIVGHEMGNSNNRSNKKLLQWTSPQNKLIEMASPLALETKS